MTPIPLSELKVAFPSQSSALRLQSSTSPFALSAAQPAAFSCFQQKFRLHLIIPDVSFLAPLSTHSASPSLLCFDLLSVTPQTAEAFHAACESPHIDIISLPTSSRLPFHLRLPSLHLARQRGITLELSFASGLSSPHCRRYLFATASSLLRLRGGGGEQLVLSSGAEKEAEMRDAGGVVAVARLMGMDAQAARRVVAENAERALWHGETRRTCRAVVRIIRSSGGGDEAGTKDERDSKDEASRPRRRRRQRASHRRRRQRRRHHGQQAAEAAVNKASVLYVAVLQLSVSPLLVNQSSSWSPPSTCCLTARLRLPLVLSGLHLPLALLPFPLRDGDEVELAQRSALLARHHSDDGRAHAALRVGDGVVVQRELGQAEQRQQQRQRGQRGDGVAVQVQRGQAGHGGQAGGH